MKGYEMILVVNGILLLILGLLILLNGVVIGQKGAECAEGNATFCERESVIGATTRNVAPFLFAGGVVLLGAGLIAAWHRKDRGDPDPPDEGPEYL